MQVKNYPFPRWTRRTNYYIDLVLSYNYNKVLSVDQVCSPAVSHQDLLLLLINAINCSQVISEKFDRNF